MVLRVYKDSELGAILGDHRIYFEVGLSDWVVGHHKGLGISEGGLE